jgi:hypothetical protein
LFTWWAFLVIGRQVVRKVKLVAKKQKRSTLDDLASRVRGLLQDLDRLLNPQNTPQPVRVPVPVNVPRQPSRNHYR